MNTKFLTQAPQIQTPKGRVLKVGPSQRDKILNRINITNVQPVVLHKQLSPAKDILKKHVQSNKILNSNGIYRNDLQNTETVQQRLQRQNNKQKLYYENLVACHKRALQELEAKNRGLQKQRNQWKQTALKLKHQLEKITALQSNFKQINNVKIAQVSEQNNSLRANKAFEDQLSKLKIANAQMNTQIIKLRQQNKTLKFHLGRLQFQIKNNSQSLKRSASPINFQREKRSHSPLNHSHQHKSSSHSKHSHSVANQNKDHSHTDNAKQLEKLRKLCGKMEKVISERNQEIMKLKTKMLNIKYMKM